MPALIRLLSVLSWSKALALLSAWTVLVTALLLILVPLDTAFPLRLCWALASTSWLFALFPLAVLPRQYGAIGLILAGTLSLLAAAWWASSLLMAADLGRPLLWHEVRQRMEDPAARDFVLGQVVSGLGLALVLGWAAALGLATWVFRHLRPQTMASIGLGIALMLPVGSVYFQVSADYFTCESLAAPWSGAHQLDEGAIFRRPTRCDAAVAEAWRKDGAPLWTAGPDPMLAPLAGRYRGRSALVLVLESQRLMDIAPWGSDAPGHVPCSPFLASLASQALVLDNYIQAGMGTNTAIFSLFCGMPHPRGFFGSVYGEALARHGPLAALRSAGLHCSWLMGSNPRWYGFDRLLAAADVPYWVDPAEQAGLDRSTWSSSWGMPDDQLMDLLWRRFLALQGKPAVLGCLTIANHMPFDFPPTPEGEVLPRNHQGGARFQDRCVQTLVERVRSLPPEQRPLVIIVADHTHVGRPVANLPPGNEHGGLEGLRLPGIILLPDGHLAGVEHHAPCSHEDLLDLVHLLLVGPPENGRFTERHRVAISYTSEPDFGILGREGLLWRDHISRIEGRWRLLPDQALPEAGILRQALAACEANEEAIWGPIPLAH